MTDADKIKTVVKLIINNIEDRDDARFCEIPQPVAKEIFKIAGNPPSFFVKDNQDVFKIYGIEWYGGFILYNNKVISYHHAGENGYRSL